jgi:putative salt-induced outer membrane protein
MAFLLLLLSTGVVHAEPPPDGVAEILAEAVYSDDPGTLTVAVTLAKKAYPASGREIDAMVGALQADARAERTARLRAQGIIEGWEGEGELGASRSTGNADETTVAIGFNLRRDGLAWRNRFNVGIDYNESEGAVTEERLVVNYEVQYKVNDRLFTLALLQYERDRFAGFSRRFTESLGLGYSIYRSPRLNWDVTLGPAFRQTDLLNGPEQRDTEARLSTQVAWTIRPGTTLTEDASIYIGAGNNTYQSNTALTTAVLGSLSARLSFFLKKETAPADGMSDTDTITRGTLVYGF